MGEGKMSWIGVIIGVIAIATATAGVANGATTFTVGDSLGWAVPPNNSVDFYQNWAANHTFQIGDSLLFNWTGTHTATEVDNEAEYMNCTKTGLILATSGVRALLNENGTRYFVCSVGTHCEQGMKLAVRVGNGIPPPPSSSPPFHVASLVPALLSSAALFFFII